MILQATADHLGQIRDICSELDNPAFGKKMEILNGSSIGDHVRHVLECFQCLLSQAPEGRISYDKRKRDPVMAGSTEKCLDVIGALKGMLGAGLPDQQLELEADYSLSGSGPACRLNSSLYRELAYNLEHTVHHLALIRIGVQALDQPIALNEAVGVAASTLRNRNKSSKAVCAQ